MRFSYQHWIEQYKAKYLLLGYYLETPEKKKSELSVVEKVRGAREESNMAFVPFFVTLSTEMELGWGKKGGF